MTFIYGYLKNPGIKILVSDGWPNQIMTNAKMGWKSTISILSGSRYLSKNTWTFSLNVILDLGFLGWIPIQNQSKTWPSRNTIHTKEPLQSPLVLHVMNTSRWFKVPFSSPSWRSLNPLKGSLDHPKKVTLNHQAGNSLWPFWDG